MLIQIAEIPDEGLRIEGVADFPRPFEDATWALDELSLVVERDGDVVFVRGDIEARVPLTCGRCLEPYTVTVHPSVDARFVPAPATRGEERELGADDLPNTASPRKLGLGYTITTMAWYRWTCRIRHAQGDP